MASVLGEALGPTNGFGDAIKGRVRRDSLPCFVSVPIFQPRPLNDPAVPSRRVRRNPDEVDHDLANLVLAADRLLEPDETPGSTLPANRSQ
jgi:hypothetical protein